MIIPVTTDTKNYDIVIENGCLKKIGSYINQKGKCLIVTDSGVPSEYAQTVKNQLCGATVITIPEGEKSKNFDEFQHLLSEMLRLGFSRHDVVIAVGGGVVGDLSGFSASCYMRGIDFYNIPTTLLSQVDSSVGGKTAIDFCGMKNIVGSFYQPSKVIIDPDVLKTLDNRQLYAGLAEVIKMAATSDALLFEFLENSTDIVADLPKIIESALKIKSFVVKEDTKEQGLRRVLNFGHTVGHAIEGYNDGKLLHGECVALGMLPFSKGEAQKRIKKLLSKYNLPSEFDKNWKLLPYIINDKKKTAKSITTVFVDTIGSFEFKDLTTDEIIGLVEGL